MFRYTELEQTHLKYLLGRLFPDPRVLTGDCWRSFMASSMQRDIPSIARQKWIDKCSEMADECDCGFYRDDHL
jgi:hypothetical protein